jgi:pimeloyl-ACP methyl ester carboxylesterase
MVAIEPQSFTPVTGTGPAGMVFDAAGDGDQHMLFLHGWCGDRSFFAPQLYHFASSYRVIGLDLPGHGESRAPASYSIEGMAADVAALGRELGLGRGVLVSHSMGAMVALALSRQAPELVSAVIMVDPPPLSQEVWKDFAGSLLPGFEGPEPATARRNFVEQMFLPTDDGDRRAGIVATMCAVPDEVAIATTKAMAAFDAAAVLRSCEVPVVVISSAVPTNGSEYLLAVNPAVTLGQTVGAGHFLQLEIPDQVNLMIERFLSINLPTPRDEVSRAASSPP